MSDDELQNRSGYPDRMIDEPPTPTAGPEGTPPLEPEPQPDDDD